MLLLIIVYTLSAEKAIYFNIFIKKSAVIKTADSV